MLAFLLLIAYAFGDAGFDEPAFVQQVQFVLTYGGATGTDVDGATAAIKAALATELSGTYTVTADQIVQTSHADTVSALSYEVQYATADGADDALTTLSGDITTFCANLEIAVQATLTDWTSGATCVSTVYTPVSFDVTYGGVDGDDLNGKETELGTAIANTLSLSASDIVVTMPTDASDTDFTVYVSSLATVAAAEALVQSIDDTFCSSLQTAMVSDLTDFTSGVGCVSNLVGATKQFDPALNSNCESGDFEVTGINTGTAVQMNFDNSAVSIDAVDSKSYLTLEFEVPTMYFFNDQTIGSQNYDRSLAISFHNRECHDSYTFIEATDGSATTKQCLAVAQDLIDNSLGADECADLNAAVTEYGDADIASQCHNSCNNCGAWTPDTSACYTSKTNYAECPSVQMQWTHEDSTSPNTCSQRLTGRLKFEELLYGNAGRNDGIIIVDGARTIGGVNFDTWEVYMVAYVETWSGYIQTSPDAGNQNLDFNNPDTAVSDWTGHLEINQERYSYYSLPFIVAFPKTIEIDASPITSYAQMIVLYAIVEQEMLTINFTPDTANGEPFGSATLLVKTQVQFPYGLRTSADSVARAQVGIDTDEHTRLSQTVTAETIVFTTEQDSTHCDGTVAHGEYCLQEWQLTITPKLCDISGQYYLKFWATCFDTQATPTECALNINSGDGTGTGNELDCAANPTNVLCTNSYSGKLQFSITAQEFCPEVLDTVETEGTIAIYADPEFTTTAVPSTNLFVNDHVYVETTFLTKTDKYGVATGTTDYSTSDDTLIESVRPFLITMGVALQAAPLQTSVDDSNGDVAVTDTLNYVVTLCQVEPLTFPYTDSPLPICPDGAEATCCDFDGSCTNGDDDWCCDGDFYCSNDGAEYAQSNGGILCPSLSAVTPPDCFQNMKWNAVNRLAFTKRTTSGVDGNPPVNSADDNEILFSLRLDERVIPVDLPNDDATITITEHVEIYYVGNTNPVRRRLETGVRRRLEQTQRQEHQVATSFDIAPNNNLAFCTLRDHLMFTGFELEVITDLLEIPETQSDSIAHLNDLKYSLATYLRLDPTTDIEIYKMDHCSARDCSELFPRRNLRDIQYMRYYIDVKNSDAANRFQTELMTRSSGIYDNWLDGKVLQGMRVDHCDPEVSDLFNGYRTADAQNDLWDSTPIAEVSSSWVLGVLALAPLMALLHL